jgi:hypothetical protein
MSANQHQELPVDPVIYCFQQFTVSTLVFVLTYVYAFSTFPCRHASICVALYFILFWFYTDFSLFRQINRQDTVIRGCLQLIEDSASYLRYCASDSIINNSRKWKLINIKKKIYTDWSTILGCMTYDVTMKDADIGCK